MYFSLRFVVWLKWIDSRLKYQNLHEDHYKNVVSEETAIKLWKPMLIFDNSIPQHILKYDPSSSDVLIVRNGDSQPATLSQWDEAREYNSKETEIMWKTVHLLKFSCLFDLFYFPFDQQKCFAHVSRRFVKTPRQSPVFKYIFVDS